MAVANLLAERRPHRADAARNFDAILAAGRKAFAAGGTDVSLDEVARQAGVWVATLYRNFPSREDLAEAVYVTEVDELCRYGNGWTAGVTRGMPWFPGCGGSSPTWAPSGSCWTRLTGSRVRSGPAGTPSTRPGSRCLPAPQQAGRARAEVTIDDVLRFCLGVTSAPVNSRRQRDRFLVMAIAGLAA